MPGTKVRWAYSQDWDDQAKCKELALNQIAAGSKVVFQVAGGCGLGALSAAKDKKVWGIGVDGDQSFLGPHILTSALKGVDSAVFLTIKAVQDGTFAGRRATPSSGSTRTASGSARSARRRTARTSPRSRRSSRRSPTARSPASRRPSARAKACGLAASRRARPAPRRPCAPSRPAAGARPTASSSRRRRPSQRPRPRWRRSRARARRPRLPSRTPRAGRSDRRPVAEAPRCAAPRAARVPRLPDAHQAARRHPVLGADERDHVGAVGVRRIEDDREAEVGRQVRVGADVDPARPASSER